MKRIQNITLCERDLKAIGDAVIILKRDFPVVEVRLFGSKARGKDDPESDIDLLVLTSKPVPWQVRNAMIDSIYDIQLKQGVVISLLVVHVDEWREGTISVLPIHDDIEENGVAT